jgi:hypothetical protein
LKETAVYKQAWIAAAAVALFAGGAIVSATQASASSPEQQCVEAGGTYSKQSGTATCSFPVGKSHNTKTVDQKGSFNSSHDEVYNNPGGNAPGGQQDRNRVGRK